MRDPWYLHSVGRQPDSLFTWPSPHSPTGAYNQTTGGVFLNQNPTWDPTKPYYSVGAASTQQIAGFTAYFLNWTGHQDSVGYQNANAQQTGVMFKKANATAVANYKSHLASNSTAALALNSQRKIVRDHTGTYHMVYESAGHIWYTQSTDGGATWQPEQQVIDGAPGINRYPTLTFQYRPSFRVVVFWIKIRFLEARGADMLCKSPTSRGVRRG